MPKAAKARPGVPAVIAEEIRSFCREKANPAIIRKYSKYFREGYDAYGVDSSEPEWNTRRDDWIARLRAAGPAAYLDAGDLLVPTGKYEEVAFSILFAAAMRDGYTPEAFRRIGKWFEVGFRNWAHTDVLSATVLVHFIADGIIPLETLAPWRDSPHKYQRRAVPVTLVSLLKQRDDYKTLLDIVEPLMSDAEREVHQGAGWFLRETWKKEPKLVERFLLKHKETGPRLIFQYATEKMTADQKARFKRTKRL